VSEGKGECRSISNDPAGGGAVESTVPPQDRGPAAPCAEVGHSGRVCAGLRPALKRACVPMALDPEEIVALMLLAALAIAWNWKFGH
jgi:hypothetical protein